MNKGKGKWKGDKRGWMVIPVRVLRSGFSDFG
jgi:hypothetical protein